MSNHIIAYVDQLEWSLCIADWIGKGEFMMMTHALFPCQQQLQFILILILINEQLNLPVDLVIFLLRYVIRKPNQFSEKSPMFYCQ